MSWSPHTACVSISFFCFLQNALKEELWRKMNTVHLFFNSAKSSQSGNKKENSKVLGVIEPYFFCSSSINSQDLWLPSFQNVTPFKSYIILPICSRYLLQKSCHNGILPTLVKWEWDLNRWVSSNVIYIWNPLFSSEYEDHRFFRWDSWKLDPHTPLLK